MLNQPACPFWVEADFSGLVLALALVPVPEAVLWLQELVVLELRRLDYRIRHRCWFHTAHHRIPDPGWYHHHRRSFFYS